MLFSYNWLQEFIGDKLPSPQKLGDLLMTHVFEVEGIEKQENDWILDIAVLPHRSDCLSHFGMATEIAAITGKPLLPLETARIQLQKGKIAPLKVRILSPSSVLRYSAVLVEGIKVTLSPQWMRQRLESLGINSINNVVDITNYVMLEMGQPLHAFDYSRIRNHHMTIRDSREGERITTLDDANFSLPRGVLVIEDQKRLIDLAGIKGGKTSRIEMDTKHIIFQAVTFASEKIYQAKKNLQYTTPAADLYAHGIDPNLTMRALERAVFLLSKFGAGKVVQIIDKYERKKSSKVILLTPEKVQGLLGIKISPAKIEQILSRLGFQVEKLRKHLEVRIPTIRQDIALPEDLVEEVGRLYGYRNIPTEFPLASLTPPPENKELFWQEVIKDILKSAGFTETLNYSFIGDRNLEALEYTPQERERLIEVENPISSEFRYLRPTLLDNLLKNIATNQRAFEHDVLRIFEVGKVFLKFSRNCKERKMVGGVIGALENKGESAFYEAKGVVDSLMEGLGISSWWYDEFHPKIGEMRTALWHPQKVAEIKVAREEKEFYSQKPSQVIGFIGEISPRIISNLKIERRVVAFYLDIERLVQYAFEEKEYQPLSRFPAVLRDLALLVPRTTRVGEVLNTIQTAGGELVRDVDLFDIYEGEELPEGKKNFAFHIVYQASDRTLTNREVDALHKQIITALEEKDPEWEVR